MSEPIISFDPVGKARKPDCKFVARTYPDLLGRPSPEETIEDVLPATGSACIYGQSGSGKTFLALDMALAISRGDAFWFGYRLEQRDVFFLALEGEGGIVDRLKAHADGSGKPIPDRFRIIEVPFDLCDDEDMTHLITLLSGCVKPVVFIDTLTRATPGLDLNSGADMGRVIKAIDRIRRDCTCLVVAIYHSTIKSNSTGATEMGHSSYRGSLDASIFVRTDDAGVKSWTTVKAKDAEDGKGHQFGLSAHEVRVNQWGNPKTSCFVAEAHRPRFDPEAEKRMMADQLENYLVSGFNDTIRRYYTKRNLQDNRPPGISRDSISPLLATLEAEGRVAEVPLPEAERNGKRQTYIHPVKRIPIAREKR